MTMYSFGQTTFNFEVFQSLNHVHNLKDNEEVLQPFEKLSQGLSFSSSIHSSDEMVIEPIVGVSFVRGVSVLTDRNDILTGQIAKSLSVNGGVNLLRKAGKYFAVGGGIQALFVTTKITATDGSELDRAAIVPSIPMVVRGYLPIGKDDFHLRVSFYGHLTWKSYIQASIGFGF